MDPGIFSCGSYNAVVDSWFKCQRSNMLRCRNLLALLCVYCGRVWIVGVHINNSALYLFRDLLIDAIWFIV